MSEHRDPEQFHESLASAQLDATRINCNTTIVLLQMEASVLDPRREAALERVLMALQLLDQAREIIGWESTSLHHVGENESRIITP